MFSMVLENPWLLPAFFAVAFFYAMAGFGGGSSYLALMSMWGIEYQLLRFTAYICNITVVSGNLWRFSQAGVVFLKRAWPLVLVSIPAAFWGGSIALAEMEFFILLALALLMAGLILLAQSVVKPAESTRRYPWALSWLLGGAIGFVSGLVGIGGGIFLAPVLHFLRFAKTRAIAAMASLYILANAVSGMAGRLWQAGWHTDYLQGLPLLVAVLLGGQLGSRFSIKWFPPVWLKRLTAVLIIYVGLRLLNQYVILDDFK